MALVLKHREIIPLTKLKIWKCIIKTEMSGNSLVSKFYWFHLVLSGCQCFV